MQRCSPGFSGLRKLWSDSVLWRSVMHNCGYNNLLCVMFRSYYRPPRLSRWSSCGTNQKPHKVISDQQEARVIMMTDQAVTRWWACGGGEGVSPGDRGQLLRWQICCINTENLIMNVWPMIPAHQAHDSRVMISLHETYNKKTAVTYTLRQWQWMQCNAM